MTSAKKTPPKKAVKKAPESDGMVEIVCTRDRLPLPDGGFLVRGQTARVPEADAAIYEASERAKRG